MSDFLSRLAARSQGEAAVLKPRARSRFEPEEAELSIEPTGEVLAEPPIDPSEQADRGAVEERGRAREPESRNERRADAKPFRRRQEPVRRRVEGRHDPEGSLELSSSPEPTIPERRTPITSVAESDLSDLSDRGRALDRPLAESPEVVVSRTRRVTDGRPEARSASDVPRSPQRVEPWGAIEVESPGSIAAPTVQRAVPRRRVASIDPLAEIGSDQERVRDTVVRDTVVRDTVVRDTVGRDTVGRDTVVRETVGQDTAVRDTVGRRERQESRAERDLIEEVTAPEPTVATSMSPGLVAEVPLASPAAPEEKVIRVTIGRIDVRAVQPPPAPRPQRRQTPKRSLGEYLKTRNESRR